MSLVTSTLFAPGAGDASAYPDQVFLAPHLGLLLVGGLAEPSPDARAAARIAIDAVRAQVERHQDAVQRASLDPSPSSRDRLLDLLDEGMQRAAQELYAFGRRRPVAISLDVLLVTPRQAFVAHVGAGRVYLLRRGLVHQLTVDPSAPADTGEVFDLSGIGRTDAGDGGGRRFSRALGRHPQVVAERLCIEVSPDDRFVLAAEDLVRALPESILHAHLLGAPVDGLGARLSAEVPPDIGFVGACGQLGGGEPYRAGEDAARLALLAPMPLFAHCTERELRAIAQATLPRTYERDGVLFEDGDPGDALYLLLAGSVEIIKAGRTIATLPPGTAFGEMALLDEPTRSATAVAATPCEALVISRDAFFGLLRANPNLAVKVLWNLSIQLSASLRAASGRVADAERRLRAANGPPSPQG
jgi:hypothetical protein